MSMAFESFCWTMLWIIPSAMELSVLSPVASCECPISDCVDHMTVPSLALTRTSPNTASLAEETTCLSTVEWQISGSFVRDVELEPVLLQM
jgi:hypothetical protein